MNNAMFYAWMSQASYLYFNEGQFESILTDKEKDKEKYFAKTQKDVFVEKYSFVSHQENTENGMSSTVFQSKEDGSYTFAMRGTEPDAQGHTDIYEDGLGIVLAGKAKTQLVDAFHYYKRLTTAEGEKVTYTETEKTMMLKLLMHNSLNTSALFSTIDSAIEYMGNVLSQDTGLGEIEKGATINFTGHSLGGHLAYSLAEMVYASCEGQYQIGDIMTYNAPGQNALSFEILNWIGVDTSSQAGFIGGKHIAFYAEQGANITAGLGQVVGTPKPVFIESDPSITGYFSMDNHSIAKLSDTLSVYNIFAKLDKDFYWDTSANNIDNALPVFNKIMEKSSSDDYNQTLETVLDKLDKLLDPSHSGELLENDKESFYQKVQRLTEKALEVKHSSFTEIEILDNIDNLTQAALQDKGIAYRYALKELNIFALTGYDYSQHNQNGELNLYSPTNPNGMTQNYIQDRLAMFNALSKGAEQIYDDIATNTHLELSEDLANDEYYSEHPEHTQRKTVFGTDGNDSNLLGGEYADHLYGGAGNDILKGSFAEDNDSDYLEGGKGFDTYHVGNGDIIFDADAHGMVYLNGKLLGDFEQDEHNQSLWYELDKNNNQTGTIAIQQDKNLIIRDHKNNTITIQDYFQAAQILSGSYFGLNIRLNTQEEDKENEEPNFLLWQGDIRPNTKIIHKDGEDIDTGIYDVDWTDHSQRDENGFLINGEFQAGFSDVIGGRYDVSNHIYGLTGNDALSGSYGDDVIDGGDGDDLITGGSGSDTIYGGAGDDHIYANYLGRTPYRQSDNDVWSSDDEDYVSTVVQGATWGIYSTTRGVDIVDGVGRNVNDVTKLGDVLYGGSGNDMVVGGNRNDVIYGDESDNEQGELLGQDGKDYLYGMGGDDLIYGNGGNDVIYGDGKADNASKGVLQYCAISEHGNDVIFAGDGDDVIRGNDGDDVIFGEYGNDQIYGGNGNDILIAGSGYDYLYGGDGYDTYLLESDDFANFHSIFDPFLGLINFKDYEKYIEDSDGKGSIVLDGIALNTLKWTAVSEYEWTADRLSISSNTNDLHLYIGGGQLYIKDFTNGDLGINLPEFIPASNDDTNNGTENETIDDDSNNDSNNGSHNDPSTPVSINHAPNVQETLNPQTLTAHQNWTFRLPENLFTDPDGDTLTYHITNLPNWLTYNEQTQTLTGMPTIDDTGSLKIEITAQDPKGETAAQTLDLNITHQGINGANYISGNKIGSLKNDFIIGNDNANTIRGNAGDDQLYGMGGNDELHGGIGNDTLNGGKGDDQLFGGIGDDILSGSIGNDYLDGGQGNDTYQFKAGDGRDTIYDIGGNDTLKISGINAEDLWFTQDDKNVYISLIDTEDHITLQNQNFKLTGQRNKIESIELDDGSLLNAEQMNQLIKDIAQLDAETETFTPTQMHEINQQLDLSRYWTNLAVDTKANEEDFDDFDADLYHAEILPSGYNGDDDEDENWWD